MKKFLVLIILVISSSSAFAEYIPVPKWEEFCPERYVNYTTPPPKEVKGFFANVSAFFATDGVGDYWYQRRLSFDKNILECKALVKLQDKEKCYANVRKIEQNKTNQKERAEELQAEKNRQYAEESRKRDELELLKKQIRQEEINKTIRKNYNQINYPPSTSCYTIGDTVHCNSY